MAKLNSIYISNSSPLLPKRYTHVHAEHIFSGGGSALDTCMCPKAKYHISASTYDASIL